jgi:hypothetical protein
VKTIAEKAKIKEVIKGKENYSHPERGSVRGKEEEERRDLAGGQVSTER